MRTVHRPLRWSAIALVRPHDSGRAHTLDEMARTTRFDVTVSFTDDTFSYDETTVIEHKLYPTVIMHTDRNTLKLVSRED